MTLIKGYSVNIKGYKRTKVIVGIEINTSYIFIEGNSYLYDKLTAFAGLDEDDIKNYFW